MSKQSSKVHFCHENVNDLTDSSILESIAKLQGQLKFRHTNIDITNGTCVVSSWRRVLIVL